MIFIPIKFRFREGVLSAFSINSPGPTRCVRALSQGRMFTVPSNNNGRLDWQRIRQSPRALFDLSLRPWTFPDETHQKCQPSPDAQLPGEGEALHRGGQAQAVDDIMLLQQDRDKTHRQRRDHRCVDPRFVNSTDRIDAEQPRIGKGHHPEHEFEQRHIGIALPVKAQDRHREQSASASSIIAPRPALT
jgi:hypothetical protein